MGWSFFLYYISFNPYNIFASLKSPFFKELSSFVQMIRPNPQEYKWRRICYVFNIEIKKLLHSPCFIVLRIFLVDVEIFGSLLILFPWGVAVYEIEFAQSGQIVFLEVLFNEYSWMVPLLDPYLLLLHQLLGLWIFIVPLRGIHAFDKILGSLSSLNKLSIESPVLLDYVICLSRFLFHLFVYN